MALAAAVRGGGPLREGWSLEEMSLPIPSSTERLTEVPTPDSNELPVEFVASPGKPIKRINQYFNGNLAKRFVSALIN